MPYPSSHQVSCTPHCPLPLAYHLLAVILSSTFFHRVVAVVSDDISLRLHVTINPDSLSLSPTRQILDQERRCCCVGGATTVTLEWLYTPAMFLNDLYWVCLARGVCRGSKYGRKFPQSTQKMRLVRTQNPVGKALRKSYKRRAAGPFSRQCMYE